MFPIMELVCVKDVFLVMELVCVKDVLQLLLTLGPQDQSLHTASCPVDVIAMIPQKNLFCPSALSHCPASPLPSSIPLTALP